MKTWIRYRFETYSTEDYRPLIFNPKYPFWCSGYGEDTAIIIVYLPKEENIIDYWDDATNIDADIRDKIEFTDRFQKPSWFVES